MACVYPGVRCWRGGRLQVTHRQQAELEEAVYKKRVSRHWLEGGHF